MSKKARNKKAKRKAHKAPHSGTALNQTAPNANKQTLDPSEPEEEETTSPYKFLALFWGIPVALVIAIVVFRTLVG